MILCIYKHVKTEPHDKPSKKVRLFNLENISISPKIMVHNDRQLNVHTIGLCSEVGQNCKWHEYETNATIKMLNLSNFDIYYLENGLRY